MPTRSASKAGQQTLPGLGLLEIDTVLGGEKRLGDAAGIDIATGMPVAGYEMHLGETSGPGSRAADAAPRRTAPDGAVSADGRVAGCYLHGLFASDAFRRAFLARLGAEAGAVAYEQLVETTLDALADHLEQHLDLAGLLAAARPPRLRPGRLRCAGKPRAHNADRPGSGRRFV